MEELPARKGDMKPSSTHHTTLDLDTKQRDVVEIKIAISIST